MGIIYDDAFASATFVEGLAAGGPRGGSGMGSDGMSDCTYIYIYDMYRQGMLPGALGGGRAYWTGLHWTGLLDRTKGKGFYRVTGRDCTRQDSPEGFCEGFCGGGSAATARPRGWEGGGWGGEGGK